MQALGERWARFWFEPVGPLNLGICRVLFFGAFFLFYLHYDVSGWPEFSSFWMPVLTFKLLSLPLLPAGLLAIFGVLWKVSLVTSCLGLFTRASTICSFILGGYLLGLPQNFGKMHHSDALVVLILGILALSRCGDCCSIDRLLQRIRRGNNSSLRYPQISGEYRWPVRAAWLVFALIFFSAGFAKLRHSGLEWAFSDNMSIMLIQHHYQLRSSSIWFPDLGLYIAGHPWLSRLFAAGAITLELSYPLALFSRRARWIIVPGVFSMQVGIWALLGVPFREFLICNLFWVPWDRVSLGFAGGFHKLLSSLRKLSKAL